MARHAVLFGRDHVVYDQISTAEISSRVAAAISVGADPTAPSLRFKGDLAAPNEDALCAFDDERVVAMAVADAHFGDEASHGLIAGLAALWAERLPANLAAVESAVSVASNAAPSEAAPIQTSSESTLVAVVLDRQSSTGFGVNFGDSTVAVVSAAQGYQRMNTADRRYVGPARRPGPGTSFSFAVRSGDMVIVHTDGIDECHYRRPATSVRPHDVVEIVRRNPQSPVRVVKQLTRLALNGIEGNPGGQDNIAVVAALV